MFDLISIGDVALDHFCKISDAHLESENMQRELCLNFGDKLPIEQYRQTMGGNNGNNAVGAARLGLKTAGYLNVGTDAAGRHIIEELKGEKIDTRYVVVNREMDSNTSVLISFHGERTILVYQQPWHYNLPDLDQTHWVHLSSMAETFKDSPIVEQISSFISRTGARLMINPGTFQLEPGLKKITKLLPVTSLLIVNKEEAELILRIDKEKKMEIKKLLQGLVDLGPKMAVITDGKLGSYSFDGINFYKFDIFPAKVVDMTGAGDAYATGVLAGLFHGKNLSESMRWGAANGASVVGYIGAQEGLLSYDNMQEVLRQNSKLVVKELR